MNIPQSVITNLRIKLQAAADAEPCTYRKWQWMNVLH